MVFFLLSGGSSCSPPADRASPGARPWPPAPRSGLAALTRPSALVLAPLLAAFLLDRPSFARRTRPPWRLSAPPGFPPLRSRPGPCATQLRFSELIPVSDVAGGVSLYDRQLRVDALSF